MKCSKCGFNNISDARFCSQCGSKLIEEVQRDKGGRRRVAVLFADISGFTPLSEKLDPEEVKDIIDSCLQQLASVVYRYEGYVDKFIGDCIMALFGAPVAHEDDPLRAVLTAIDMHKEIKTFNLKRGLNLELAIGINYGMVATGDLGRPGEYTVMGDTVNLAQRLQYNAPKGKIYASEAIYINTKNEISYKKLKTIRVKGKSESVKVFEPQKVRRTFSMRKIEEIKLIGRSRELKELQQIFEKVKSQQGQVVSLIGDAGIGKSKLAYEFRRSLGQNVRIIEGRGLEYLKHSSFRVLREMIRSLFQIDENDRAQIAGRKLTRFIAGTHQSTLIKLVPFIKYFMGMELNPKDASRFESMKPDDRARLVNQAILTLFTKIAVDRPTVFVFEDCHWIDAESIVVMQQLAKEIAGKQSMIFALYRPEFNIGDVSKFKYHHKFKLQPLSIEETSFMLRNILNCDEVEEGLLNLLTSKSGRVPFYVHELTSSLRSENVIFIDKGMARLKAGMETAVPRTLDELLMTKIDKLSPELRRVVDIASVIGDQFSLRLIEEVSDDRSQLKKHLKHITQIGIVSEMSAVSKKAEIRYNFSHSLMREAVYQSLFKKTRIDYHQHIGNAIEKLYLDNLAEHYDALAKHFMIGGNEGKAVGYLEKSADRKKELYLNEEAIALYQQAISKIDRSETRRIALMYEKISDIYQLIGRYQDALVACAQSRKFSTGDLIVNARSYMIEADIVKNHGQLDRALELLHQSRQVLAHPLREDKIKRIELLANIASLECWILRIKGRINESMHCGSQAIDLIKKTKNWHDHSELQKALARAYFNLAILNSVTGNFEKAIQLCEETLILAEGMDDRIGLGNVYNTLGTIYRDQGKFDQAINAYTMKLKISQELGDKKGVGAAYGNLGNAYQNKGDFDKAIELLTKYLSITESLGYRQAIGVANNSLGITHFYKGNNDEAIKLFKQALKIGEEIGDKRLSAITLGNLGEVYENRLEHGKAIELFEKYLKMSKELADKRGIANASLALGAAFTESGKYDEAKVLLDEAEKIYKDMGNKKALGNVYHFMAKLFLKQGNYKNSMDKAEQGLDIGKESGSIELQAYCFLVLGKIASAQDDQETAAGYFHRALELGHKFGNQSLTADCNYEMGKFIMLRKGHDLNTARKYLSSARIIYHKQGVAKRVKEINQMLGMQRERVKRGKGARE